MTWGVHMRDPRALWRELGPRRFLGFQIQFLGSLSQYLLAPILWSFWLLSLGLPHPLREPLAGIWGGYAIPALFGKNNIPFAFFAVCKACSKPTVSRGARKMASTRCAIKSSRFETCVAVSPRALVKTNSWPRFAASSCILLVSAMRHGPSVSVLPSIFHVAFGSYGRMTSSR